jgi:hypothetical protein
MCERSLALLESKSQLCRKLFCPQEQHNGNKQLPLTALNQIWQRVKLAGSQDCTAKFASFVLPNY